MLTPEELSEISRCYAACHWDPSKETAPAQPEADGVHQQFLLTTGRVAHIYLDSFNDAVYVYKVVKI